MLFQHSPQAKSTSVALDLTPSQTEMQMFITSPKQNISTLKPEILKVPLLTPSEEEESAAYLNLWHAKF